MEGTHLSEHVHQAPGCLMGLGVCLTLGSVVSPLIRILDLSAPDYLGSIYLGLYSLFKDEDMGTMISNRHVCGVGQYAG